MNNERYISWEQISKGCLSLVMNNAETLNSSEAVLALSDDLVSASIVANLVSLPLIVINKSELCRRPTEKLIDICKPIQSGHGVAPVLPKLIIVSSMVTIASEIESISDTYKERGHELNVITLFHCNEYGFVPDCFWQRLEYNTKLIFPWEL